MDRTSSPVVAVNKTQLFWLSVLALVTAGIGFSIRQNIGTDLTALFNTIDKDRSGEMVGEALGYPFLGFAIVIAVGSPLLDYIGMGRLLALSGLCFVTGTGIVVFAEKWQGSMALFHLMCVGMFVTGLGWGLVETVINPLAATLYPEEKTSRLNILHAWWPGGIIIGGLMGLAMSALHVRWEVQMGAVVIPAAIFGLIALTRKFPPTERVAAGVSATQMWKQALRPFFILWFLCMFLTAASELAPGQWVNTALSRTVGMNGTWLLVYVSGLMFVMRHFAGPLAHRLSPVGLLWASCLMASLGLLSLSFANSPVTGLLAATVWGTGVCYMWPTMLASASERFPRGGALIIGLMGTGGTLSVYFVLPLMGKVFDYAKMSQAGGMDAFNALAGPKLDAVLFYASQYSFRVVAVLPAILLFVFGGIWLRDKARGGYRPEKIALTEAEAKTAPFEA
jgi:fucose permease